jgi:hypothetical protein
MVMSLRYRLFATIKVSTSWRSTPWSEPSWVFWMERELTFCKPDVNDKPWRLGRPIQSTVSTAVSAGKLSVDRIWTLSSVNESSIWDRLSPESETIFFTFFAVRLPVIRLMPSNAMSSVVPVAIAMLPE